MLAEYDESAEVSDYLQVVLNFGFLAMSQPELVKMWRNVMQAVEIFVDMRFGCVAPSMCILCFVSNLPIMRLLAFRFSFAQKRVVPIITHGLGSWELILNALAYFGVSLTSYIVPCQRTTKTLWFLWICQGLVFEESKIRWGHFCLQQLQHGAPTSPAAFVRGRRTSIQSALSPCDQNCSGKLGKWTSRNRCKPLI